MPGAMNVDLTADDARRLTMLLGSDLAADRARRGIPPAGTATARIEREKLDLLARLQPACRWAEAGDLAQALAAGCLHEAGL